MNKKTQKGSVAILMTVLVVGSVMTIALTTSDIMRIDLMIDRDQLNSTKAYFAAESGAERVIWEVRKASPRLEPGDGSGYCPDPGDFCFSALVDGDINACVAPTSCGFDRQELPNGTIYNLKFEYAAPTTTLASIGIYGGNISRQVELRYRP